MRHELKTDPAPFAAVLAGVKTHEIRRDDRGFAVGDELLLRETLHPHAQAVVSLQPLHPLPPLFTGREVVRIISHIQRGYGLMPGWCVLSFALPAVDADHARQLRNERDHALAQAAEIARNYARSMPDGKAAPLIRGRWEGECAASAHIAGRIESEMSTSPRRYTRSPA